ncbi:hypothetical protein JDS77_26415 [Bacillus cereus group sp. N28]|uniref:hypothetical protein n=1 Tax=Bacillus TaxID=1386 RepID=UPI0002798D84|nr:MULTISPECIES: hypothetical protein [Bacillus]EJS10738.1 hypothetical protein IKS_05895 [Bacillus cereus VDM062]MBG9683663.1 hypothetical protein [Bacillus mycoides]MBJ7961175.1 hypothetical protein [Bacillus cereus group sp. N28]PRD04733.1 hypothetical protein CQ058_30425 [Bacillus sp. MYb56]UNP84304.1 hypothetical protein MN034_27480 [Bacillus mycoides]
MNRINMKKMIPAAFVLSTALFVAPGFSSAATDTPTKVGNLPVVISSQEAKAPMTAEQIQRNGMALPYIPTGPYEEFPNEWHVSTNDGALIDYVYVDVVANDNGTSINNVIKYEGYKILKADGTWLQDGESYSKTANKGEVLYSIAIPKTNPALSDTKLKKNVSWKLIDSNVIDKNSGYHWSKAVTSGVSHNVTVGLSYTIGMEVGLEGVAKVNQSLTASFGYGFTLNSESTVTKTFDFNPKPADYAYDQYRTALYQQVANYSVAPGAGLQKWISDWENNEPTNQVFKALGKQAPFKYKVKDSVEYPVDVLVALTSK